MKIVIFGAGLIGSQVVTRLVAAGHDAVALGRADKIDTATGHGLSKALVGADVVLDLTNSSSWADADVLAFFQESTTHLLAAEEAAGIGHHVILSIVGADRLPDSGYMRAKIAQEDLVKAGPVPYTIVRSTQFFEFIAGIADAGTTGHVVHATPAHLQPIASHDVADRVAEVAAGSPINGVVEIAGPQPLGIDTLVRELFATTGDERTVTTDPEAGYFGAVLQDSALTPTPGAGTWVGPTTFAEWLKTQA